MNPRSPPCLAISYRVCEDVRLGLEWITTKSKKCFFLSLEAKRQLLSSAAMLCKFCCNTLHPQIFNQSVSGDRRTMVFESFIEKSYVQIEPCRERYSRVVKPENVTQRWINCLLTSFDNWKLASAWTLVAFYVLHFCAIVFVMHVF